MRWTWDPNKNEANKRKHGISFETAERVFGDILYKTEANPYPYEERFQTIGRVNNQTLFVVHTLKDEGLGTDAIAGRIISARLATRRERQAYEESRS